MTAKAEVLVHGATGFTGRLVCAALQRRGVPFALGGRSLGKLAALSEAMGGPETCMVDVDDADSLRRAVEGRRVVCACAGPFVDAGEAMLATCARAGVHYADTSGEQLFVARAVRRYQETAEASGACVLPAMAYEVAPADWGAHIATERIGGPPDGIDVLYGSQRGASRAAVRSALAQLVAGEAMQFVGGTLVHEQAGSVVRTFVTATGERTTALSFPSPEAVLVPSHTGARSLRTFAPMGAVAARALHAARGALPSVARAGLRLVDRGVGRSAAGPDADRRAGSAFEIVVEARRGADVVTVRVAGHDPYGLTAEIQAYAVERLLLGVAARGVVAPSVAFPANEALRGLAPFGVVVG